MCTSMKGSKTNLEELKCSQVVSEFRTTSRGKQAANVLRDTVDKICELLGAGGNMLQACPLNHFLIRSMLHVMYVVTSL